VERVGNVFGGAVDAQISQRPFFHCAYLGNGD